MYVVQQIEDAKKPLNPTKENDDDDSAMSTNDESKITANFYYTYVETISYLVIWNDHCGIF